MITATSFDITTNGPNEHDQIVWDVANNDTFFGTITQIDDEDGPYLIAQPPFTDDDKRFGPHELVDAGHWLVNYHWDNA